ncbi:MAG: electron transporter RnfD, partial [Thermotoga sp.]
MKLITANAPHIRSSDNVRAIMVDVLIALIPAVIGASVFFGWYALFLCILGMVVGELIDYIIMRWIRGRKDFVPDGSGAVTGV